MLRAVIKNVRILDGRAYIGIGILGILTSFGDNPDVTKALMFALSLVLYVAYAFAINNCFDSDTDVLNPRKRNKNPIASGELSFRVGVLLSFALILMGMIISFLSSRDAFIVYATMTALATFYSAPPRLKARPIADVVSHGLFFGTMPFIYGAYFDGNISRYEVLIGLALFLYSMAMELRNHLEDYESDLKAGLKTTPILIGKGTSEKLVLVFSLLSLAILLGSLFYPFALTGVLSLIGTKREVKISYKLLDWSVALLLVFHALTHSGV
ncbi:UbiA family prenyltransferase [Thermococcus aggregans]|uniref:UbiA family prenyltransferase n=1 Tax=Thermococcus aggregans TaxID=110163 RepID=A0A9E7MX68_THEAG|nr:UbiA family prenyltransferase [Thermococcus aggregans]USS40416.1 UbiA family prenyltransferase [Thermococcus aggregans]